MAGGSYNLSRIPIKPEELGESINVENKIAILFGREGDGLSNKEIGDCDICVSIPTDPTYPIMNISHAAAIIFYELFKNKHEFGVEGLSESRPLEKEYLQKDMDYLIDCLDIPEHKKKNGKKTFNNIISRAFITGREAHTMKGILRRLKNKIGYTDVVFNMMPELFALGDLQQVYEVILNKKLLDPAFRRIIADKVEKTEFVKTGGGHRPSALFRYKKSTKKK